MNRLKTVFLMALTAACLFLGAGGEAYAAPNDTIREGVTADGIDLSGMTKDQATAAIQGYVNGLGQTEISLQAQDGQSVSVMAGELGISWKNTELAADAVSIGKKGNIVARYKAMKDLKNRGMDFHVELDFDRDAIARTVAERCEKFNA